MLFLGPDTYFALHGLLMLTEAALVTTHQAHNPVSYEALESAWVAMEKAGVDSDSVEILTVIDFTKPSYLRRMEIYQRDVCRPERFFCTHGRNTGEVYAREFSNVPGSKQTSLGLYRIGTSYTGKWGVSVRMHGLEPGVNDKALDRHIVLHSAWYAAEEVVYLNLWEGYGPRIGRSQGCPAVPETDWSRVRELLQPGTFLYIHGENQHEH